MSFIKTKGFVIQSIAYRDSNRLLKILTPEHGLITCSAQGAKSKNSTLRIASNPFVFAEFDLFYYRERYRVQAASIIDAFLPLMEDIKRLTCISHLAELVLDVLRDNSAGKTSYPFWAYASYKISTDPDPVLMTNLAQLKYLSEQGFAPWVDNCLICGKEFTEQGSRFYFAEGGAICEQNSCRRNIGSSAIMDLSLGSIAALIYLIRNSYQKCFNMQLSEQIRQEIINFSERYLNFVMEKGYKKLDMIKSLENFERGIFNE
ncbi:MAG: DNA repair protein RecO [Saccharofermentanales bacterium]|jgi:DNA repair protein RecO (recombination protein O)